MAFSQISTSVTILNSGLIGYMGVSLTNYTSTSLSLIASGSGVEVAGAFFKADSDITPNATSWTAITTATTAYLAVVPSGTAGSQILSASWTATSPTWSSSKQGWYASAASSTRIIGSAYKNGAASQHHKFVYGQNNGPASDSQRKRITHFSTSGTIIIPYGITRVYVTGCAAGGDGIYSATSGSVMFGGGGGSWAIQEPFSVIPGETLTVTLGPSSSPTTIAGLTGTFTLNGGANAVAGAGLSAGGAIGSGTGAGGNGGGVVLGSASDGAPGFQAGGITTIMNGAGPTDPTPAGYGGGGGGKVKNVSGCGGGGGGSWGPGGHGALDISGLLAALPGGPAHLIIEW